MPVTWKNGYTVHEAAAEIGIGRTKLLELVADGKIEARKAGKVTIIIGESLAAFFGSLPRAQITLPAYQKEKQAREAKPAEPAKRELTLASLGLP